jgi:hypothetical protein
MWALTIDFLNRTLIVPKIRARIDKWDCIKLKSFLTSKETVTRIKKGMGEILCQLFIKELLSIIYKDFKILNTRRTIQLINRQMNWTDGSQKKYKWPTNKWKLFNSFSCKEYVNQNDTEILSHPSQNDNYHENKQQMLVRLWDPLCTVDENLN